MDMFQIKIGSSTHARTYLISTSLPKTSIQNKSKLHDLSKRLIFPRKSKVLSSSKKHICSSKVVWAAANQTINSLEESVFTVSSGLKLEVLSQRPSPPPPSSQAPLVFIHGSYHAAWCWAIHFLPYFASKGYEVHALSLRGQGPPDKVSLLSGTPTLDEHTRDLAEFVNSLDKAPVLVGHSFGGAIVQRMIGNDAPFPCPPAAGAVLACSVPPYGNGPMIARFLRNKPIASMRLTFSLAARGWEGRPALFRESFFSEDLPEPTLMKYMEMMSANSRGGIIDLKDLNSILPLVPPKKGTLPVLVIGAEDDFCVDQEGVNDTAKEYEVTPVYLKGTSHDIMLDTNWEDAAEALNSWLSENIAEP